MSHNPFDEYIRNEYDSKYKYPEWFSYLLIEKNYNIIFATNIKNPPGIERRSFNIKGYSYISKTFADFKNDPNKTTYLNLYTSVYIVDEITKNIIAFTLFYIKEEKREKYIQINDLASINGEKKLKIDPNYTKTNGLGSVLLYAVSIYAFYVDKCRIKLVDATDFKYYDKFNIYGLNKALNSKSLYEYESHKIKYLNKAIPTYDYFIEKEDIFKQIKIEESYCDNKINSYKSLAKYKANYSSKRSEILESVDDFIFNPVKNSNYINLKLSFEALKKNINDNKQYKKVLESLIHFFANLRRNTSWWYTNSEYIPSQLQQSDRKEETLTSVIIYLSDCIDYSNYPNASKLQQLFWYTLLILPLIRGWIKKIPRYLSYDDIIMTSSAKSLFLPDIVPEDKLEFETIDFLSLDWVRVARNKSLDDKIRYKYLLKELKKNIPFFELRRLYDSKDIYYKLVKDTINK